MIVHQGVFKRRYKRFFADVETQEQQLLTLHCPNTGAMTGLLQDDVAALYSLATPQEMLKRKTPGTLEALQVQVQDKPYWVGVNTHRANQIAARWFAQPDIVQEYGISKVQQEVKLAKLVPQFEHLAESADQLAAMKTRVDFMLHRHDQLPLLVEVKSATLCEVSDTGELLGYFPDAVSTRATAQLRDLLVMKSLGFDVLVLYVSQHQGINEVEPAAHIDPTYTQLVTEAKQQGVSVRTLPFDPGFYGVS